jgi:predicted Rossmann-fold nucleotide-binding protein
MKILVCGGREFGDMGGRYQDDPVRLERKKEYEFVMRTLDRIVQERTGTPNDKEWLPVCTIIQGGARGADAAAADWAVVNWTGFQQYDADWKKHGKSAGSIRNQKMLFESQPDLVVAFPGGRGTADMVAKAKRAGVEVIEVEYNA